MKSNKLYAQQECYCNSTVLSVESDTCTVHTHATV